MGGRVSSRSITLASATATVSDRNAANSSGVGRSDRRWRAAVRRSAAVPVARVATPVCRVDWSGGFCIGRPSEPPAEADLEQAGCLSSALSPVIMNELPPWRPELSCFRPGADVTQPGGRSRRPPVFRRRHLRFVLVVNRESTSSGLVGPHDCRAAVTLQNRFPIGEAQSY